MDERDFNVTQTMIDHGGSFIKLLGELARRADHDNLQRLKDAFPEYWLEYLDKR